MSDPELAAALTEMGPRVLSDLLARSDLQQLRAAATEAMQLEDGSYWDARPPPPADKDAGAGDASAYLANSAPREHTVARV